MRFCGQPMVLITQVDISADGASPADPGLEVQEFLEGLLFIVVGAVTGTPTIDLTLQFSPDGSAWHSSTISIPQCTSAMASTNRPPIAITNFGNRIRLYYDFTTSGAGSKMNLGVKFLGKW